MNAKDMILVACEVTATVAFVYVAYRSVAGPDSARLTRMAILKRIESVCQAEAQWWATMADAASRAYDAARATA